MPGIKLTGQPKSSAAGGSSFNDMTGADKAGAGLSGTAGTTASDVRALGTAARSATSALNRFTTALQSASSALGGGRGGGGDGGGGGTTGSGKGRASRPQQANLHVQEYRQFQRNMAGERASANAENANLDLISRREARMQAAIARTQAAARPQDSHIGAYRANQIQTRRQYNEDRMNANAENRMRMPAFSHIAAFRQAQKNPSSPFDSHIAAFRQAKKNPSSPFDSHIQAFNQYQAAQRAQFDADYKMANYENRNFDLRARRAAAANQWGASALGAGKRGAGMLGLGGLAAAGEGLASAGIWAVPLALALSPQIGGLAAGAYNAATSRYTGYATGAYGMARAGGFSGSPFLNSGFWKHDTIGQQYGLGRTEQMAALQAYGIVPTSIGGMNADINAIGKSSLNPSTSGMDQSQVIGIMRMMGGNFGTSASSANNTLYDLLSRATAQGLDRSQLAQNFSSLMGNLAAAGNSVVPGSIASLMADAPGAAGTGAARSGAAIANVLSGAAANQSAFGSPVQSVMYMRAAAGVRSQSDLVRLVGGPAAYKALASTGQGQAFINAMLNKHTSLADRAQELATNLPATAKMALATSTYSGLLPGSPIGGLATSAIAGFAGASPSDAMTYQLTAANGAVTNFNGAWQNGSAGSYASQLKAMGVPVSQIPMFLASAKQSGVSPVMMAMQAKRESAFGMNQKGGNGGGEGQFLKSTWNSPGIGKGNILNPADNIAAMARYDAILMKQNGGNAAGVISQYSGGNYTLQQLLGGSAASAPLEKGQSNMLRNQADMSDAATSSSQATYNEVGLALDGLVTAIQNLKGALEKAEEQGPSHTNPFTGHFIGK